MLGNATDHGAFVVSRTHGQLKQLVRSLDLFCGQDFRHPEIHRLEVVKCGLGLFGLHIAESRLVRPQFCLLFLHLLVGYLLE